MSDSATELLREARRYIPASSSHYELNGLATRIDAHFSRSEGSKDVGTAPVQSAGIPKHLARRGMRPDGTFPLADDDEQSAGGLYNKYEVRRTDGTDVTGGKHDGCEYFVLDLTHDRHARAALLAYAESCKLEYPLLSNDLRAIAIMAKGYFGEQP